MYSINRVGTGVSSDLFISTANDDLVNISTGPDFLMLVANTAHEPI